MDISSRCYLLSHLYIAQEIAATVDGALDEVLLSSVSLGILLSSTVARSFERITPQDFQTRYLSRPTNTSVAHVLTPVKLFI